MKNRLKGVLTSQGMISFIASVASIAIGLIFGYVLLVCFNQAQALNGLGKILFAGASSAEKFSKVLYQAAPRCSPVFRSVSHSGPDSQHRRLGPVHMGTFFAMFAGLTLKTPRWLPCSRQCSAARSGERFPVLKALFNVNEVITSNHVHWIGMAGTREP
jgi:simple sugar transport system permease protein